MTNPVEGTHGIGLFERVRATESLPQAAEAFAHRGFPDSFRVELSLAKLFGVVLLLTPVSARPKEWAYAGFSIHPRLCAARHLAAGDGPEA